MGFKVLLRAQAGELVTALNAAFEEQAYILVVPTEVNWLDQLAVTECLQQWSPSIVINFSIPNSLDEAEKELNVLPLLVNNCVDLNVPLLHFSSYRVFGKTVTDGEITEDMIPKPRDDYGKKLLKLEQLAAQVERHMLLRVSWLLNGSPNSLLETIIPKLLNHVPFFVSDHDFGSPVQSRFLANLLLAKVQQILCGSDNWGVFHIRSSDSCSEAELCDSLVRLLSSLAGKEVDLPLVAGKGDDRRMLTGNALLSGNRITNNFGVQLQSWRKGLKALIRDYLDKHP